MPDDPKAQPDRRDLPRATGAAVGHLPALVGAKSKLARIAPIFFLAVLALTLWASSAAADAVLTVTKRDELLIDVDGDGNADPGDTIRYTVVISNTGDQDAVAALFADTIDSSTTLSGTFSSTPIARNDAYESLGNVGIVVPAASGLVQGADPIVNADNDPDGGTVIATAMDENGKWCGNETTI